jgi:hypothetical protein
MKISGNKPNNWSIILSPSKTVDMRAYLYEIQQEKNSSVQLMKDAFSRRDAGLFREGEQRYQLEEKKERQINDILEDFHKKEIQMAERIFQVKRSLYLLTYKRRELKKDFTDIDKKTLEKLNIELKNLMKEEIEQKKIHQVNIHLYSPYSESIRPQGPVPEPPNVQSLPVGLPRKRIIVGNKKNKTKKINIESESESESENENEDEDDNKQDGGDIKIISL